jgi:uncharacterized protein (DUF488 family)
VRCSRAADSRDLHQRNPGHDLQLPYQSIDTFICSLVASGVGILADVRLNAISRKPGFSKRALGASLADAGIGYWHVPELGNPGWNRAGFGGSSAEVRAARARFAGMIRGEAAGVLLAEIAAAAKDAVVAVMCVEADERACHRYVILQELYRRTGLYGELSSGVGAGEDRTRRGS